MKTKNPLVPALICAIVGVSSVAFAGGTMTTEAVSTKFEVENVISLSYGIVSPRDASSGLATGHRQYKPMCVTVAAGPSLPLWYNVLIKNELIKSLTIESDGLRVRVEKVALSDVSYSSDDKGAREQLCFSYQKIEIEHLKGKTTVADEVLSKA